MSVVVAAPAAPRKRTTNMQAQLAMAAITAALALAAAQTAARKAR